MANNVFGPFHHYWFSFALASDCSESSTFPLSLFSDDFTFCFTMMSTNE